MHASLSQLSTLRSTGPLDPAKSFSMDVVCGESYGSQLRWCILRVAFYRDGAGQKACFPTTIIFPMAHMSYTNLGMNRPKDDYFLAFPYERLHGHSAFEQLRD